jgi:hypothetical protein
LMPFLNLHPVLPRGLFSSGFPSKVLAYLSPPCSLRASYGTVGNGSGRVRLHVEREFRLASQLLWMWRQRNPCLSRELNPDHLDGAVRITTTTTTMNTNIANSSNCNNVINLLKRLTNQGN